ncbi:MAG: ATP-grasp domain-containing protein [Bacteroidota bacterium]
MILYHEPLNYGHASNVTFYAALEAFFQMGFHLRPTPRVEDIQPEADYLVVGGIRFIQGALHQIGITPPPPLDYPPALRHFLGRKIWTSTVNELAAHPSQWNVFIKPKGFAKKFTGRWVKDTSDLVGCGDPGMNTPIWVSEPRTFLAEWRVFVRYQDILDVRPYKGDWRLHYDPQVIEAAVDAYQDAPAGYALDFGVTAEGETCLVEANDGYSLGSYGLFHIHYAKLLSARWSEMVGREDLCNY